MLLKRKRLHKKLSLPPPTTSSIPTDGLIKLKEIMNVGILTQEEFDAKKKQLLRI
ncbi:SHOCT domain-containing protein [Lysinibacillus fusiformis]|uniref:SHOCT domain-containing protein n=1 Tax=Lysinibacillus fusiformis TaxID=28031 RepID=UPI000E20C5F5